MAQADEVARRRELARLRQQKRRAALKLVTDGAALQNAARKHGARARIQREGSPTEPIRPNSSSSSPRVHDTKRLETLGSSPEEFTGVPPATDTPAELVAAPDPDAVMGAKKFAALIGFMTKLSLDDAMVRYSGLAENVPGAGALLDGDPEGLKKAAVEFVTARAERCALKHGFGLNLPYEDEVVTIGAGAASSIYLLRKFTGRLPDPSKGNPQPSRTEATGAPPSPTGDGPEQDEGAPAFHRISLDVPEDKAAPVPSWMAR